tara:strand:+ start:4685 stop:5371 length:687 start_codon:yes stop_codon:yes gene_type:complete
MKKLFRLKAFRIFLYVLVAMLGMAITYVYGTFQPNYITLDKLKAKYEKALIQEWNSYGFIEPSIEYNTDLQFVKAVGRCIDFLNLHLEPEKRIHRDIIIAMAVLETGYGKSRFAHEANNLFGIRTWNKNVPQLKAKENPDAVWGVKKYKTKCLSVKDMIDIINRHHAYEDFRIERTKQLESGKIDIDSQIDHLHKWSTNPDYTKLVKNRAKKVHKQLEAKEVDSNKEK